MDRQRTDDESPLDISGRRRSPVTFPGFRKGKLPGNFGKKYPPETFTPQEILGVGAG
jgi:hypothetical protein